MTITEGSWKKQYFALRLFLGLAFVCCYFYFKHTGLLAHYRLAGLALGIAWAVILIFISRREPGMGWRTGLMFSVLGVVTLIGFFRGSGDSLDGLFVGMCLGLGAREFYLHYKSRNHSEHSRAVS